VIRSLVLLALSAVALAGCSRGSESNAAEKPPAQSSSTVTETRTATCPVTLPNGESPPGEKPSETHHGNGRLWTVLSPQGTILARKEDVRPDGSIEIKFPWWAAGVYGDLTIRGRRLDATAPPIRATINPGWPETGFSGDAFWASFIIFPTEGCWEVTGTVEASRLTFVALVVKA
jgi:hypothetical protein